MNVYDNHWFLNYSWSPDLRKGLLDYDIARTLEDYGVQIKLDTSVYEVALNVNDIETANREINKLYNQYFDARDALISQQEHINVGL